MAETYRLNPTARANSINRGGTISIGADGDSTITGGTTTVKSSAGVLKLDGPDATVKTAKNGYVEINGNEGAGSSGSVTFDGVGSGSTCDWGKGNFLSIGSGGSVTSRLSKTSSATPLSTTFNTDGSKTTN